MENATQDVKDAFLALVCGVTIDYRLNESEAVDVSHQDCHDPQSRHPPVSAGHGEHDSNQVCIDYLTKHIYFYLGQDRDLHHVHHNGCP